MKGASLLCLLFLTSVLRCSTNQEVIKANPEDNVILQCKGSGNNAKLLLKWIRPDLRSEGYVYFFREGRSYEQYQHPMFRGRVELRDPEMKDGDASVILKRVGMNDTGSYKCFIVNNSTAGTTEPINIIHLKVEADQKNITAETGDAVTLPCQVPRDTQILVLEWIRPDLEPENVFFYKNGQSHPEHQHPSFRNRVELKDEHMEEGDLSLILKNVMISDTGTYECHVYQSERNHTMSIIDLKVDDSGNAAGQKLRGTAVGSVLVLLLAAGFCFWILKMCKTRNEGETGQQGEGETGQQGEGETGQQGEGETGQQGEGETVQQAEGETGQQGEGETVQQAEGETVQQAEGETGQQAEGETGQEAEGETVQQAEGETGQEAEGKTEEETESDPLLNKNYP